MVEHALHTEFNEHMPNKRGTSGQPLLSEHGRPVRTGLLAAGVGQLLALFTPAAQVRLAGGLSFREVESAGVALAVLGVATIGASVIRPRVQAAWRVVPGSLSLLVLAVLYARIRSAPTGTFLDPLVRHGVRPSWGFVPMGLAALASVLCALGGARVRTAIESQDEPLA